MNYYEQYRAALLPAIDAIDGNRVDQIIDLFRKTRDAGRHIFVFGNGGSAASASHFVCDMIKGASLSGPKRFQDHGVIGPTSHAHRLWQRLRL